MQSKRIKILVLSTIAFGFTIWLLGSSAQLPTNNDNKIPNKLVVSNPYVKEYSLPEGTWPNGILVDKNGVVWTAGSKKHELFKLSPEKEYFSSFQIINNVGVETSDQSLMVWAMTEDKDGMIWFSQQGPNPIWRFDPNTKRFDVFDASAAPFQMKTDNAGNIWFTTLTANTIGIIQKINPYDREYLISEFHLDSDSLPSGIFLEEEHVWISMIKNNNLVKFVPIKDDNGSIININKILEVSSKENSVYSPTDVTVSGDASVWITEHASFISKFSDDFQRTVKFPTSQNQYQATSLPFWIRSSEDSKGFWFNQHTGNKIGFFDIEKMELIEYGIPSRPSDGYIVFPLNIAIDPTNDDLLWFSEWNTDKIGVIDKSIPLPFDIILLENVSYQDHGESKSAKISISIVKNQNLLENTNLNNLLLNASSTLELNAGLGNMTVTFSRNNLDLTETDQELVDVLIQNITTKKSHTLSLSVTNGEITKSLFFELTDKELT